MFYANKRLGLARQNDFKVAEAFAYVNIGYQYSKMGRYAEAFQNLLLSLKITEDPKNEEKKGGEHLSFRFQEKKGFPILQWHIITWAFLCT